MKVESLQQTSFLLYKSRIWTFILGSLYIFEKRNSGEKNISISAAYPQDTKSKRANEVYQIFLPDPRARFTKQGLWWQYLHQNCDLLLFNGVGILAGGIFYGCSGVAVYDPRWEARDGYGFVLINTNGMQAESATWSRLTKRRILMNTHQHRLKETWSKSLSDHWEGKQSVWRSGPTSGYEILNERYKTNWVSLQVSRIWFMQGRLQVSRIWFDHHS